MRRLKSTLSVKRKILVLLLLIMRSYVFTLARNFQPSLIFVAAKGQAY